MKPFFTIEDLLKIEGFATPLGMDVRYDKLYQVYKFPQGAVMPRFYDLWGDGRIYGNQITEYAVYHDPCDPLEIPDIKKILKATKDEDGHTIHVVFDDLTSGSIDYEDHYCTYHRLREMHPCASLVLMIREHWNQIKNPTRVIFMTDGDDRFHVCIACKHGAHEAVIPVSNITREQRDLIKKYV